MPIKNFVTGVVPFLEKYTPFVLETGLVETPTVSDMITFDLKPRNDGATSIEYVLGSEDLYIQTLNVVNVTNNAEIELSVRYFKNLFHIDYPGKVEYKEFGLDVTELKTVLAPQAAAEFIIVLNNSAIDAGIYKNTVTANIVVIARNLQNGTVVTKNTSAVSYDPKVFPRRVRIE